MRGTSASRSRKRALVPAVEGCEARQLMSGATAHIAAPAPTIVSAQSVQAGKVIDVSKYAAVQFEASVTSGPHAGASLNGVLMIQQKGNSGQIVGRLDQRDPIGGGLPNRENIPVTGEVHGNKLTLQFHVGNGVTFSGTGRVNVGIDGTRHITLTGTGNLKGSTPGDSGDWGLLDLIPYTYKIKVINTSGTKLPYLFGFLGSSSFQTYSTPGGFTTTFTFNGSLASRLTPQIRFDSSFAPGIQEVTYNLTAGGILSTIGSSGTGVYKFVVSGQSIRFFIA